MKNKTILAAITGLLMASASLSTQANEGFSVGAHYHVSAGDYGNLKGVGVSAGYRLPLSSEWAVMPELRYITSSNVSDDVSKDYLASFALKAQYTYSRDSYVFAGPAFSQRRLKQEGFFVPDLNREIGAGFSNNSLGVVGGLGFQLDKQSAAEVGVEYYQNYTGLNISYNYFF